MSDTVIAAIITTMGGLLAALLVHYLSNKKRTRPEPPVSTSHPKPSLEIIKHDNVKLPPERFLPSPSLLKHSDIVKAIESQPPFQRDKVHESFIGSRVRWNTKLTSISHYGDSVSVLAEIPDGEPGCLFCITDQSKAQVFNLLPEGTPFSVTGTIKQISKYEVDLTDCSFDLLNELNKVE